MNGKIVEAGEHELTIIGLTVEEKAKPWMWDSISIMFRPVGGIGTIFCNISDNPELVSSERGLPALCRAIGVKEISRVSEVDDSIIGRKVKACVSVVLSKEKVKNKITQLDIITTKN